MKGRGKVRYIRADRRHSFSNDQIYAFERDRKRFNTLKSMLSKAHCENVEPLNADFLATDPSDPAYTSVTHM
jgi:putative methyltransferase